MLTNLNTLTSDLNPQEYAVLAATIEVAAGNGHDFTFGDEVVAACTGMTSQQVGGYLTALQAKGYIYVHAKGDLRINGRLLGTSQITFEGAIKGAIDTDGGDWLLESKV